MAAGKEEGELGELRKKLLTFLDISSCYEPEILISDFPFDGNLAFELTDYHHFTALKTYRESNMMRVSLLLVSFFLRSVGGASLASRPHGKTRASTFYIRAHIEGHVHGRGVSMPVSPYVYSYLSS